MWLVFNSIISPFTAVSNISALFKKNSMLTAMTSL